MEDRSLAAEWTNQTQLHGVGLAALIVLGVAIGVSLFVHCVCFMGVSYFGQIKLLWYLTLAIIGAITPVALVNQVNTTCGARGAGASRHRAVAGRTVMSRGS